MAAKYLLTQKLAFVCCGADHYVNQVEATMDESNGNKASSSTSEAPPLSRSAVSDAMESAAGARASDSKDSGFQGNGPTVLARPPVEGAAGKGSILHDPGDTTASKSKPTLAVIKDVLADTQEAVVTQYRVASESTDDFVHDSPWKAITFAVLGGVIVGMLAAR
jgi:ElaB/YqjD/DUF883 family membrane-anchored ribosome-binding protein